MTRFLKIFSRIFIAAALIAVGGVLIAFPQKYTAACFDGLCLWAECVVPSLFPFMVITSLLIKLGVPEKASKPFNKVCKKLNLPTETVPLFIMSACSGYPAGSKILCQYYEDGRLSQAEAKKLAPLLSTCGPLFALGTVGNKAFGGNGCGAKLLLAALLSVIATSLVYCLFSKKRTSNEKPLATFKKSEGNTLQAAFYGGVTACITACGFICFFYTLSQIIADFGIIKPLELALSLIFSPQTSAGLCKGLIEATGGCFAVANAGGFFALPAAGFLITFGGASILAQQICYLKACKVSSLFFIGFKLLQGLVCFLLLCLIGLII